MFRSGLMNVICCMKKTIVFFLLFFSFSYFQTNAQFSESKERKKMWRKSARKHKNRDAFNPYLSKKNKPSSELAKENIREQKRQLKAAKKQKRKNKKKLGYN